MLPPHPNKVIAANPKTPAHTSSRHRRGDLVLIPVEKSNAQSLGHAGAAVISSGAAEPDDKVASAFIQGVSNQLPHAVRGGVERHSRNQKMKPQMNADGRKFILFTTKKQKNILTQRR